MSKAIAQPAGGKRFAWLLVLVAVLALLAGAQLTATSAAAASIAGNSGDRHENLTIASNTTTTIGDAAAITPGYLPVFGNGALDTAQNQQLTLMGDAGNFDVSVGSATSGLISIDPIPIRPESVIDRVVDLQTTATYSLNFRWSHIPWNGNDNLDQATAVSSWEQQAQDWHGFIPAGMSVPGDDVTAFTTNQAFWIAIKAPGNPWTSLAYSIAAEELQHILTVGASEGIQNYSQAEISPRESVMGQTTTSILDASPQVIVPGERILEAIDLTSSEVPTSWVTPSLTKNGGDITVSESPRGYQYLVGSHDIASAMGAGAILLAMLVAIRRTSAKIATIISNGKSSDCRALSRIRGKPSQGWTFSG